MESERKQMETLFETLARKFTLDPTSKLPVVAIPSFVPLDSSSELWLDYWARFLTFIRANLGLLCSLAPPPLLPLVPPTTFAGWYAITIDQQLINTVARGTLKFGSVLMDTAQQCASIYRYLKKC